MEHTASEYLEELNSLATLFQIQDLNNSDICLLISLKLFPREPAAGIGIFELDPAGNYNLVVSFGMTESAQRAWMNSHISTNSPVVEAMRTSQVVCVSTTKEMLTRYPEHSKTHDVNGLPIVIAAPIRRMGSMVGAIALIGKEFTVSNDCRNFLETVASLVALKMIPHETNVEMATRAPNPPLRNRELTDREKLVQRLMKQVKTNAQIADELGYSESTIRQDAVSMFSKLGVKSRRAASDLLMEE
ncbi:MAG: hypothetical protein EB103_05835 [Actinobacteria bacterium]|nr:hypothetical protein [Actinomycetota bacterium]